MLAPLVASGNYVGVSVGYRLTDVAIWPAQIHDCKAAIRWVRANADKYKIDAEHIGATGSSAGGHLVSLLGTSGGVKELEGDNGSPGYSSRVGCVVDLCGPSDFPHFLEQPGHGGQSAVVGLFGGPPSEHLEAAKAASPITWVSADDPPFMVVHGSDDTVVPPAQGESFAAALEKAGVPVIYIRMEGAGHSLGGPELIKRVHAFFERELRGEKVEISAEPIKIEPSAEKK
jgi:acetyl esterase/lipase